MTLDALRVHPTTRNDLARLAHHAEGAGDREAILEFAPAATRQAAAARAHRSAARLFELALRHADDLPPAERAQLLDEFSVECDITNRRPEAIEARRQAAALWRQAGHQLKQGQSLSAVALLLQITGQIAEAEEVNHTALEILEPLKPNRELISAYNMEAWLSLANADNARGVAMAEKGIALAQHFEDEEELPRLYEIAGLCWLYLDHTRGAEYLERALALALQFDHATRAGNIYANLSSIYVDFHQFAQAEEIFALGIPFARERDLDSVRAYMEGWLAILKLHRGDWIAAEQIAAEAAQQPGTSPGRGPALTTLGRLSQGDYRDRGARATSHSGRPLQALSLPAWRPAPIAIALLAAMLGGAVWSVFGAPDIAVSASDSASGLLVPEGGPNPAPASIQVRNRGSCPLALTAAAFTTDGKPWLSVSPTAAEVGAGASTELTLSFEVVTTTLTPGNYVGSVHLTGTCVTTGQDARGSPRLVAVNLTVTPIGASLVVDTSRVEVDVPEVADQWLAMAENTLYPGRFYHTAIWTGYEM
jgi:hypothetical protein